MCQKEELKNNPEKLKELVRNDSNTDRSTKPVAIAPTSVAPKRVNAKMRFAVAQPAAVASNNVNDLIKVTKQTIKVGDGKDDVVAAHMMAKKLNMTQNLQLIIRSKPEIQ